MTGPAAPPPPTPGRPAPAYPWRPGWPVPECHAVHGWHSLTRARLYASGWLCDRHSPWYRTGHPDPTRSPRTT